MNWQSDTVMLWNKHIRKELSKNGSLTKIRGICLIQGGHFKVGICMKNQQCNDDDTIFYEQKHLMEPFGNVLFAAEYTNKVKQRI